MKVCSCHLGHVTMMAAMPIYGKNKTDAKVDTMPSLNDGNCSPEHSAQ